MQNTEKKQTRQEREWNRRRQDILDAASRLIMAQGFTGTTMQMIADAAEFSVGYIYKHFPSKKILLNVIIDSQMNAFENDRRRIRKQYSGQPLETLRAELKQISRQLRQQGHLVSLFLSHATISSGLLELRLKQFRREDVQLFREAAKNGEIRCDDPGLLAATFGGLIFGLIRLMSETGQIQRLDEIPGIVEDLLLGPLVRNSSDEFGKEQTER